jgi:hypothetical protein
VRRWLARRLVWLSGQAARIKTRKYYYTVVSFDPWETERSAKPRWSTWSFSYRLLSWAMHLDWVHWPHWGLDHKECLSGPHEVCTVCGGVICAWDDEED